MLKKVVEVINIGTLALSDPDLVYTIGMQNSQ